jgi:hypothetical protein
VIAAGYNVSTAAQKLIGLLGNDSADKGCVLAVHHAEVYPVFFSELPKILRKMLDAALTRDVADCEDSHKMPFYCG